MSHLSRNDFLKMGTLATLGLVCNNVIAGVPAFSQEALSDDALMQQLAAANDKQVMQLLETVKAGNLGFSRKTAYDIAALTASYAYPGSAYYHNPQLVTKLELLVDFLSSAQTADGTVNIGNLESPPDTAFLVEILCPANSILLKEKNPALDAVNANLKKIIEKAGDALCKGGVHTPNHRWVVSAAMAQVHALYPGKKYTNRIAEWLDEGVYMDKDGHFPERSGTYSSVETTAFITMARFLNKPALFDYVRRNLRMMYYYMEDNGELVSNDSRRQDQYQARSAAIFYLQYRYMAIHDKDPQFAAIAKKIESALLFDKEVLQKSLFNFLENEALQQALPTVAPLENDYEKLFSTSHLLRIKKGSTAMTLFGGTDWPLIIASGRSCSPDFFSYRKGNAILKYMRLSSAFFSMGYFYSEGIRKEGNKYILHKKTTVPYYQPLPKNKRNKAGDYLLSPSIDDRFWNKMDFKNRPLSNVKTQEITIECTANNGVVALDISVEGLHNVPVVIELCFAEGGMLSGVTGGEKGNSFLEKDFGTYSSGGDSISFGPGQLAHKNISGLEGERYSTHFGLLRTEGMHVYITGITPFRHVLNFS